MRSLAVRVLNDFGVDGIEPQSLGSRKARLALHLLALAGGQVVTSSALTDALWGDTPPAKPDDQLAVLVSRLRSVLGRDRIEHRDHGYLLRCDWLDATELAGLTGEIDRRLGAGHVMGAAAAARVALSLIHGDGPAPLPGTWAQLRRADLERLIRRARQVAATALLAAGDWMAAADAAATALEYDPYDEAALRVLLRAQVMGGRVAAALAAYASTRERLADELGTDPSPETEALQLAILRGELVPPGPAPAPAALGLVGREEELAYLDAVALRAHAAGGRQRRGGGDRGRGRHRQDHPAAHLGRPAGGRRGHGAGGHVRAARPGHAAGRAAGRAGRTARRLGPEVAADLLEGDEPLLGPVLAPGPGPVALVPDSQARPVLADSMLGPAVLYAALVRLLGRLTARGPVVVAIDDAHLAGPALPDWLASCGAGPCRWPWWPRSGRERASPCRPPGSSTSACSAGTPPRNWSARRGWTSCTSGPRGTRCSSPNWPSRPRAGRCPRRWSSRCPRAATSWAAPGRCCGPRR